MVSPLARREQLAFVRTGPESAPRLRSSVCHGPHFMCVEVATKHRAVANRTKCERSS